AAPGRAAAHRVRLGRHRRAAVGGRGLPRSAPQRWRRRPPPGAHRPAARVLPAVQRDGGLCRGSRLDRRRTAPGRVGTGRTYRIRRTSVTVREHFTDAIIVGAGFGGLYQLIRLRELGLDAVVIERAPQVRGTWYWNRYPGARCDITSLDYSYSFDEELQQEWEWSEKFATQPEILRYAEHVAERYDLHSDIRFERAVTGARWDESTGTWVVTVAHADETGAARDHSAVEHYRAKYLILAVGNLSATHLPPIEGIADFGGRSFHSAQWPSE